MAQKFTVPITVKQLTSASSDAVTVYVDADTYARLKVEAGGRLVWGSGSATGDVTLYRESADILKTDDSFKVGGLFTVTASSGDEGGEINLAAPATNTTLSGNVAIDIFQNKIRIFETGGSNRGAYIDLTSANTGVGSNLLSGGGASTLDGLTDVTAPTPTSGDFLKWNGTAWVNDPIDLGTDTTGNYVASLVAGTGVTLANNTGEGATPTISVDGDSIYTTQVKHTVKNDDSITLTKGTVVYTSGSNGTNILVKRAQANSEQASAQVLGFVEADIAVNAFGYVVTSGLVTNIDTNSATVAGDPVWLSPSTAGGVVYGLTNKPYAPNHLVYLGVVTRKNANTGEIFVHINNGWELDELHSVDLKTTAPSSGDFLKYNGTVWVNDAIDLGTDTNGNYVQSLVAGTGITLTNATASEGGTPTIAVTANTYQPLDADLTAIAGLAGTSGVLKKTAADTWALDTSTFVTTADTGSVTSTMILDGTIVNGDISASAAIVDTKLATISTAGKVSNSATTATASNTASTIVARDASGNFTAGTITASLIGNASTVTNGVYTTDTGTVTSAMIANGTIVDADINSAAAISLSKLASGTSAQVVLANSSGVPTYTSVSGDVTITNAGVTSIKSSVALSGAPTATTATAGTNTTQIATTAFTTTAVRDSLVRLYMEVM